jgi:regulatory protein
MPRTPPRDRTPPPPLDQPALERLALRYVERFATSEAKLADYLGRKLRERGAEGAVDPRETAARMVALGYVDDRAYAEARARGLARRGLGERRVTQALREAGIDGEEIGRATAETSPVEAALAYARRRRIGPFARELPDPRTREKQIAALVRAGHHFSLARKIAALLPGSETDSIDFSDN